MTQIYNPTTWVDNKTVGTASVMNNIEQGIVNAIDSVNEVGTQLEIMMNHINIEDYKHLANGNDYSNALSYIIENIVDNKNKFTIVFNKSKTYVLNTIVNKRYIRLTGGAIINGRLELGLKDSEMSGEWYDTFMNFEIDDLTFNPSTNVWSQVDSNTTQGIVLKNARDIKISRCTFKNMVYPIKLLTRNNALKQHVNRLFVTECNFFNVKYNLYAESANVNTLDGWFEYGDINFSFNNCQETKIANIILDRVDGFVCQGNTFFLERESYNIRVQKSTILNISNNQLFEAGDCAVSLENCYVSNVNSNNIFWAGKKTNGSAIKIFGDNCWGDNKVMATITANIIEKPYGNGIEVVKSNSDMQGVVISNNIIYMRDTNNYKAIINNNTGVGQYISGNVVNGSCTRSQISSFATSNANSIMDDKPTSYINLDESWVDSSGTISVTKNCLNVITLTSDSVTSVNGINIGSSVQRGTELIISNNSSSGNKTIINSSNLKTRSGSDITLLPKTVAKFMYFNGVFSEI